jgi:aspartyl-tRNA(Asn)/glutamyl-tRNA(Gln) amidotransferase subunit A
VGDAALALNAIAGYDSRDPHSAPQTPLDFVSGLRRERAVPRLGRVVDLFDRAKPEVRDAADAAVARLADAGAEIDDVELPMSMDLFLAVHWVVHNGESAAIHFDQFAREEDHYFPTVRANVQTSELLPAALYVHARRWKRRLRPMLESVFEHYDALIAPTSSDKAPRVDNSEGSHRMGDPSFQVPWTCFGLPNLTLPTGIGRDNLPDALQVIGGSMADARVLAVGQWCEEVFGRLPSPLN